MKKPHFSRPAIGLAFALLLLNASAAKSQIPNGDFESWNGNEATNWLSDNVTGVISPVTRTSDAHGGAAALRAEVVSFASQPYPPTLYCGTYDATNKPVGFPYAQHASTFSGYYKFTSVGGDVVQLTVVFLKNGGAIGTSIFTASTSVNSYTRFDAQIDWLNADNPDTAYITLAVSGMAGQANVGSVAYIDDLTFGNGTGAVAEPHPAGFALQQNYPNPFNPTTSIAYSLPVEGSAQLDVFDVYGGLIATLVNSKKTAGPHVAQFDASTLPSGVYFYRLTSGSRSEGRWMQLIK